jgi:NAD(P)-dependent dehydrogenase (short-subunit alcohol dehydrogenase family)
MSRLAIIAGGGSGKKAAVSRLLRAALATYSRHGPLINAVALGLIRTPATERLFSAPSAARQLVAQHQLGRIVQTNDVVRGIAWLLSGAAAWITEYSVAVDGGFSAVRPLQRAH